jgi:glycosyltransferase involved in cell wall biosynthesis
LKVLFLTRYGTRGPSSRLRAIQFFPRLEALGIHPRLATLFPDTYLEARFAHRFAPGLIASAYAHRLRDARRLDGFDAVWLEKEVLPWVPAWFESAFYPRGLPWIVDFDDAHFHRYDDHGIALVRSALSGKIPAIVRAANAVTAGSRYLEEWARSTGAKHVVRIPTVVDVARYDAMPRPAGAATRPFTIGWIGSPLTARFLDDIREPLEWATHALGARILLIGAGDAALKGVAAERVAWSQEREAALLQDIDVGIMPLPDTPFERGKCGYKLIQYMASGKPVVASPVGANNDIVAHAVDGFIAAGAEEWKAAFERIAGDRERGRQMGAAGREKVRQSYGIEAATESIAAVLQQVSSSPRGI